MAAGLVAPTQRYSKDRPCPICGGWDSLARGTGRRCHGFASDDGRWARCSREEFAGGLPVELATDCYIHRLTGDCNCGECHDPYPRPLSVEGRGVIAATYDYRDERDQLLYQVVRFHPKDFRQRRPEPGAPGGWVWNLDGVRRVLYRLAGLLAADRAAWVYAPEGEKDVDALVALGLPATCNPGGASKWRAEYGESLRGRRVAVLPDNDAAGLAHAETVAQSLAGVAAEVRIVLLPDLPPKGDVSDWLATSGTVERLAALVEAASPYEQSNQANRENRAKREKRAFSLTPLGDLLAEPEETVAWTVEGLLPSGGVSLVGAKPKVGKSTLARNIAFAVARGETILDRAAQQGPVIYLALEEKRQQVAAHFRRMGASPDDPILVHVGSAPEEALDQLRDLIGEHRPVLAIIDPLLKLVRVKDGNDYAEMSRALEPLIDLARDSGCHLLCVHHLGKGERDGGDDVLGSTALFGAVDTLLKMRKAEGRRVVESVQRYGDDLPATVVALDPETGVVSAQGQVEALRRQEVEELIRAVLGGGALPEHDIRERVGGNQRLTAEVLRAMCGRDAVRRTGAGKRGEPYLYALVEEAGPGAGTTHEPGDSRFSGFTLGGNRENRETVQVRLPAEAGDGRQRVTL